MKVELIICAEKILKEANSDNVSVINLMEDFYAESYPAFISKAALLIVGVKESGDTDNFSLPIKVKNNDKDIVTGNVAVDFMGKEKSNTIVNITSLPIQEEGSVNFIIYNKMDPPIEIGKYSIKTKNRSLTSSLYTMDQDKFKEVLLKNNAYNWIIVEGCARYNEGKPLGAVMLIFLKSLEIMVPCS